MTGLWTALAVVALCVGLGVLVFALIWTLHAQERDQ